MTIVREATIWSVTIVIDDTS